MRSRAMKHDFPRTARACSPLFWNGSMSILRHGDAISQIANVSIPEPRQLLIQPYEKNMTAVIERAIMKSDLGINPMNDGSGIRLTFPR